MEDDMSSWSGNPPRQERPTPPIGAGNPGDPGSWDSSRPSMRHQTETTYAPPNGEPVQGPYVHNDGGAAPAQPFVTPIPFDYAASPSVQTYTPNSSGTIMNFPTPFSGDYDMSEEGLLLPAFAGQQAGYWSENGQQSSSSSSSLPPPSLSPYIEYMGYPSQDYFMGQTAEGETKFDPPYNPESPSHDQSPFYDTSGSQESDYIPPEIANSVYHLASTSGVVSQSQQEIYSTGPLASTSTITRFEPVGNPSDRLKKQCSKLHQCDLCKKRFPRPSSLKVHMHVHTKSKPFRCSFPGCGKRFTVASNAKRHLRTHGVLPTPSDDPTPYNVGFTAPVVLSHPHFVDDSAAARPVQLYWVNRGDSLDPEA